MPTDPRSLVKPGVNAGKAAFFNVFWVDCEGELERDKHAKTCGEYRARHQRGKALMEGGSLVFFGADEPDATFVLSPDVYNNQWRGWGLRERPKDFDERVRNRWGVAASPFRNPYPLPGEDPKITNGGSGQLPLALTQVRNKDGSYTGNIGITCHWCHSSEIGLPEEGSGLGTVYGTNAIVDIDALNGVATPEETGTHITPNRIRGGGTALFYPLVVALDEDRSQHFNEALALSPAQGTVNYPVWWNIGHRTRKFYDGSFAVDNSRPVMSFYMPYFTRSHPEDIEYAREWVERHDQDVDTWVQSLRSPVYPGTIDDTLAQAGAILFHDKDLWAAELNNKVPRPAGGNGSCASCHGVYSPRYVHDTRYLDTPELEGIASQVVPLSIIGTDAARFNSLNAGLKEAMRWTWWAFGTNEEPGKCFGVTEPGGYYAPPLYGIWATAPYFHNGSVPNVWEILKPQDRRAIWRRVSTPPPADDPKAFMGFDTSIKRAYDAQKLGWKYDTLQCGDPGTYPGKDCSRGGLELPVDELLFSQLYGSLWASWNVQSRAPSNEELEHRKIYNTHKYSQSNSGHEFTSVLTDAERYALLEYLKTL